MSAGRNLQRNSLNALRVTVALAFLFLLHRAFSFSFLNPEAGAALPRLFDVFFVGFLSDIWISCAGGLIVLILALVCARSAFVERCLTSGFIGFVAVLLCLHQGYVEFFGIPALPFHFRYLVDAEFLNANGFPRPSLAQTLQLIAGLFTATLVFLDSGQPAKSRPRAPFFFLLAAIALATGAHALNIRWRVQHFIPEPLQLNVFERLAILATKQPTIPTLTSEQMALAFQSYKGVDAEPAADLRSLILWKPSESKPLKVAQLMKAAFQGALRRGKRPLVLVVLLESARPSETSVFASSVGREPRLTPNFDELSSRGLLFRAAYSSGTVTRSGQEAVWCGTLSSMYSSLMRERSDIAWDCLPRRLNAAAESFWLHGGDANFDGQRSFWQKQGVSHIVTREDFGALDTGKGWGVSDRQLFILSAEVIKKLKQQTKERALLGQILTVTNHIPWALPDDASNLLADKPYRDLHASAKTASYVDDAIGALLSELKQASLWEDSIVFFVSDHGAKMPPMYDLYPGTQRRQQLMTHINLLVSGGITEAAVAKVGKEPSSLEQPVSQASVAPFIAWLFDEDGPYFAEPLFSMERRAPVFSQLEDGFFFPETSLWIGRDALGSVNWAKLANDDKKAYSYLISFLKVMEDPKSF